MITYKEITRARFPAFLGVILSNATTAGTANSVVISSDGQQTGRYLSQIQQSIARITAATPHYDFNSIPVTPGASGGLTLSIDKDIPFIIGMLPWTYEGNTSPTSEHFAIAPAAETIPAVFLAAAGIPSISLSSTDTQASVGAASPIDFTGVALLVDAFGGNSQVVDTLAGATVAVGGVGNAVTLGGANQTLFVDSGSSGAYTEAAGGNTFVVGSYGAAQPTASGGQTSLDLAGSNLVDLIDPTASAIVTTHQGANTIVATAGVSTVFAAGGGDIYDASRGNASFYFVGDASTAPLSTVTGGGGNATLFAESGVVYAEGSGNSIYVGGTGTSTVTGGSGHDTLFGGKAGDLYQVGGGTEFLVNGGGADTISGGSVGPTVYGNNGGSDVMVGTRAGVFAAFGSNDVLDASRASQGNQFFALNVPEVGNATLVGSSAAPSGATFDRFAVESVPGGTNLPHQITIQNFQTGDAFFLEGYSAADNQTFSQAVARSDAPGGSLQFTLSDNTTVTFTGQHPTAVYVNGTIAI